MADKNLENVDASPAGAPVGLVVGGVLGAAIATFVIQNTDSTEVQFLMFETRQPLWAVLVITVVAALVLGELVIGSMRRSRRKSAKSKKK